MKTPREILLARHRGTEPKLDAIRRGILAKLQQTVSTAERVSAPREARIAGAESSRSDQLAIRVALRVWQELVLPCRRTWAVLAAAWLCLLAAHLSMTNAGSQRSHTSAPAAPDVVQDFKEQRRILAELLQPSVAQPPEPPHHTAQPRTDAPYRRTRQAV